MFKEASLGVKVVAIVNIIINLLLLIPWYFILRFLGQIIYVIGLIVILTNIFLGIGVLLLRNWARLTFIVMQAVSLVLSIWPFLCILTLGLGNPSKFGDTHELWAVPFTVLFFRQIISFIIGMSFPALPILFSIFCIFYFLRFSIKKQFKVY